MRGKKNHVPRNMLFDIDNSGTILKEWDVPEGILPYTPPIIDDNVVDDNILAEQASLERDCSSDMVCWQYLIREQLNERKTSEQFELLPEDISLEIKDTVLKPIPREIAKSFIEKYEWLGNLGVFKFGYGLYFGYKLGGVACFSKTTTWQAEVSICGKEHKNKVILLSRGACANWCPNGTNSHLISLALKAVERDTNYRIVLAYSDRRAGEVGTVYQATNWYFIGWGATGSDHVPKALVDPSDVRFHTRGLPKHLKSKSRLLEAGHEVIDIPRANKGRYIYLLGSRKERKQLMEALKFKILQYPKREDFSDPKRLKKFNARKK